MGGGGMADAGRLDGAAVPRPAGGVLVPGDQPAGRVAGPRRRGGAGPVRPQLGRVGGIVPGLILSLAFVVYIVVRVKMNPSLAPAASFTEYRGWEKFRPLVQYVVPLVSIFVIVVASMSAGWATPTESAAIGALFTILLAAAYRALTVQNLVLALRGTASISGMILFIILGATTFSQILSFSGASNGLVELIAN